MLLAPLMVGIVVVVEAAAYVSPAFPKDTLMSSLLGGSVIGVYILARARAGRHVMGWITVAMGLFAAFYTSTACAEEGRFASLHVLGLVLSYSVLLGVVSLGLVESIAVSCGTLLIWFLVCRYWKVTGPVSYTGLGTAAPYLVMLSVVFPIALSLNRRLRFDVYRATRALEQERLRSEALLLNVLPGPIAERLKGSPATIAESFSEVSVLFADIVGFTAYSAQIPASALVATLNQLFSRFDELAERHGLEKIKTIGDAYMVAAGVPVPRADHARAVAEMALDLRDAVTDYLTPDAQRLQVRIGIHCGPATAGVIGLTRFAYDLWGDTVNTASRMESLGLPGEIQMTDAMREKLPRGYDIRERGLVEVRGKGPMRLWLLKGRVRAAAVVASNRA
jgi:class 3 adenylate cyclase